MSKPEWVQLNVAWIEAWMIRNKFSKSEFSRHLGRSTSWWNTMTATSGGRVKRRVFDQMAEHFGFSEEDALIRKSDEAERKAPPKDGEDDVLREIAEMLISIDKRLAKIEKALSFELESEV